MNKRYLFITAFLVMLAVVGRSETDPVIEKTKTYTKTYSINSNDRVKLENSFGEMKINTWDKNEVKVDVTIIAKSGTAEKAQEILDKINIEDGKNSDGVYFKTKADNLHTGKTKMDKQDYKEEGMQINYVVYLPSNNPLDASNSFGALIIGDYKGAASLQSKFGSLTAGKLSNAKQVHVEFGKANIEWVNNGKVTIKFSKATLGKFSGDVNSVFEFCEAVNIKLDNSISQLDVKSSYSTVEINLEKDISADFDIKTNFGDIDNGTSYAIKEEDNGKKGIKFDKHYSGTIGKGSSKINIKSEFGKIKFL
ncbi:MAG: hypothetical protein QM802_25770 [Agriterribacter sp.]